jgi:DNA helicase-2/ATP-dependent DNA helicase PcrA
MRDGDVFSLSSMSLTPEEQESVNTEEKVFATVKESVVGQIEKAERRLYAENQRARALTSEIHETRRVEDKALLASDEGVSHALKDSKREELETLKKQLDNPYFARISLEEEEANGSTKIIEYKLGFAANTDLRIIDWRKAPISKLYYEYKEGDDYLEEILGRERCGKVLLRNRIEVERGELKTVQNRFGTFHWNPKTATWESGKGSMHRRKSTDSHLPEILSLITAEQFRSITVDADTAILIQGVAGSGKTTVALHRLAWLLHHENSPLRPRECVFLMLSPALRRYVENSLPSAGISDVAVRTYHEWAGRTLKRLQGDAELMLARPATPAPAGVQRVKRSLALLKALEAHRQGKGIEGSITIELLQRDIVEVLSNPTAITSRDETRLISEATVREALAWTRKNFEEGVFDWADDALLLRACQLRAGGVINEKGEFGGYGHIIVDEVQDLSPIELSTIIGSVKNHKDLTLVGDTSQNIDEHGSFPGWEKLRKHWNFSGDMSKYVSLEVSHRSTLPIMRLADHIQQRSLVKTGRNGRVPIWFKTRNESHGIEHVLKWLNKAVELYPSMVTAVICATPEEAKFAYKMLQPTFGQLVRLGDAYSFSFEEGILVTDVHQVKGLEFFSVLLWNPTPQSYGSHDYGRNLLYVAVTRAEENLCLVTWGRPASALPTFGASKLVRSMDMTIVDEESEQE